MQKKIEYVARYVNFAYNCRKFPNIIMAKQNTTKKHIVTSFHNLAPELQEAVKQKYPLGFTEAMMRVDKPNGDFFYAVPFDTDEIAYMVKIDVKIETSEAYDPLRSSPRVCASCGLRPCGRRTRRQEQARIHHFCRSRIRGLLP